MTTNQALYKWAQAEMDPMLRNSLIGAGIGGAGLGAMSLLSGKKRDRKDSRRIRTALLDALAGATIGGLAGGAYTYLTDPKYNPPAAIDAGTLQEPKVTIIDAGTLKEPKVPIERDNEGNVYIPKMKRTWLDWLDDVFYPNHKITRGKYTKSTP